jgi:mannose/cellobiose epimerase-like protein (N-acyl-D-glucosamine 2-epimerase family)
VTGQEVHRQRLRDVRQLIVDKMIDPVSGAGGNQFDADLTPVAPIVLPRTWIAERTAERPPDASAGATSYGHNLELAWLLARADEVLGDPPPASGPHIERLAHHAVVYGLDRMHGGIFREGPHQGSATDRDKEFWQNSEALVGFLTAYRQTGDGDYLQAFLDTWLFARTHLVHPRFGEWCVHTAADGTVLDGDLGNAWKVCYHTGRAALECLRLLRQITND